MKPYSNAAVPVLPGQMAFVCLLLLTAFTTQAHSRELTLADFTRDGGVDFIRQQGTSGKFDRLLSNLRADYQRTGVFDNGSRLGTELHTEYKNAFVAGLEKLGARETTIDFAGRQPGGRIFTLNQGTRTIEVWLDVPSEFGQGRNCDLIAFDVTSPLSTGAPSARGAALDMHPLGPLDSRADVSHRQHYGEKCYAVKAHVDDLTKLGVDVSIDADARHSFFYQRAVMGKDPAPRSFADLADDKHWIRNPNNPAERVGLDVVRKSLGEGSPYSSADVRLDPNATVPSGTVRAIQAAENAFLEARRDLAPFLTHIQDLRDAELKVLSTLSAEDRQRWRDCLKKQKADLPLSEADEAFVTAYREQIEQLTHIRKRRAELRDHATKFRQRDDASARKLKAAYAESELRINPNLSVAQAHQRANTRFGQLVSNSKMELVPTSDPARVGVAVSGRSSTGADLHIPAGSARVSAPVANALRAAAGRVVGGGARLVDAGGRYAIPLVVFTLALGASDAALAASQGDLGPSADLASSLVSGLLEEGGCLAIAAYGGLPGMAFYVIKQAYDLTTLLQASKQMMDSFTSQFVRELFDPSEAPQIHKPMETGRKYTCTRIESWDNGATAYRFVSEVTIEDGSVSVKVSSEKLRGSGGFVGALFGLADDPLEKVELLYTDGSSSEGTSIQGSRKVAGCVVHCEFQGKEWKMRVGASPE